VAGVFLVTSSFTLCGKRGTDGAGLALVARLVPVCRRGRRGSLCVAGLALGDVDLQFVWQVWRLWYWVGSGGALGSRLSPRTRRLFVWQAWHLEASASILCGRRGTWRHRPGKRGAYGAGLALVARLVPVCPRGRGGCLCGRRGIWKHRPPFFVVGVALGNIDLHFVWQAWHLWHWAGSGGALGCSCFWKNRPPFCVAGLALGDIGLHFV